MLILKYGRIVCAIQLYVSKQNYYNYFDIFTVYQFKVANFKSCQRAFRQNKEFKGPPVSDFRPGKIVMKTIIRIELIKLIRRLKVIQSMIRF